MLTTCRILMREQKIESVRIFMEYINKTQTMEKQRIVEVKI